MEQPSSLDGSGTEVIPAGDASNVFAYRDLVYGQLAELRAGTVTPKNVLDTLSFGGSEAVAYIHLNGASGSFGGNVARLGDQLLVRRPAFNDEDTRITVGIFSQKILRGSLAIDPKGQLRLEDIEVSGPLSPKQRLAGRLRRLTGLGPTNEQLGGKLLEAFLHAEPKR